MPDLGTLTAVLAQQPSLANERSQCGLFPLTIALATKDTDVIHSLLQAGASVDVAEHADSLDGQTILDNALADYFLGINKEKLICLITAGLPLDRLYDNGRTLLMCAAWQSAELVQRVINAGADPNMRDRRGWTALMYAAALDASSADVGEAKLIIRALLASGADLMQRNDNGERAIDIYQRQTSRDRHADQVLLPLLNPGEVEKR